MRQLKIIGSRDKRARSLVLTPRHLQLITRCAYVSPSIAQSTATLVSSIHYWVFFSVFLFSLLYIRWGKMEMELTWIDLLAGTELTYIFYHLEMDLGGTISNGAQKKLTFVKFYQWLYQIVTTWPLIWPWSEIGYHVTMVTWQCRCPLTMPILALDRMHYGTQC